jgi:hypothetical protein
MAPQTEADLQSAVINGMLGETHTLDLRGEIGTRGAKTRFAKDIAAFALTGELIIIGVEEGTSPPLMPAQCRQPIA